MSKESKVITMPMKPWNETFEDTYGNTIKLFASSAASEDCIWLSCKDKDGKYEPMHLNVTQAKTLISKLQSWVNEIEGRDDECTSLDLSEYMDALRYVIDIYRKYIKDCKESESEPVEIMEFLESQLLTDYKDKRFKKYGRELNFILDMYDAYLEDCHKDCVECTDLLTFMEDQYPVYSPFHDDDFEGI